MTLVGYIENEKEERKLKEKFDKGFRALNYKLKVVPKGEVYSLFTNLKKTYTRRHQEREKLFLETVEDGQTKKYLARERQSDKKIIFDLDSYPLFFGNMDADYDNNTEYRKFSFVPDSLQLIFCTTKREICNKLTENGLICNFFMQNNFGTRKSKGFGSFYVDENDKLYYPPSGVYKFNHYWPTKSANDIYLTHIQCFILQIWQKIKPTSILK